ncbi:MAG: hypothetical protein JW993_17555 [Sedimentisphaerales bacterium]|nr:hypothetical protein [Sedimentisphaerales bacterium]
MPKTLLLCVLSIAAVAVVGCAGTSCRSCRGSLPYAQVEELYSDNFSHGLSNWVAEGGQPQLTGGEMELDTPVGSTVWFKPELSGNVLIEYDVIVLRMGGANDRVSDLNCFWMATDPAHPEDLFAGPRREGVFARYHGLNLYYVGYGGNTNKTTRFRRYHAGERKLLGEYTDPAHLIIPNHTYHIQLVVCDGVVEYYRDGERLFRYEDTEPYQRGHFGLRTVENHLSMDDFRVVRIAPIR